MSYTGLTTRQSARFTNDIELFIEFAVENTANDLTVVDSGKHLKSLATQFVEEYGKALPKKRTSAKKALTDDEKEERAQLKAEKLAKKQAKQAAESEEKKKLREEKALEKAKEKANWMTPKRLSDPNDDGRQIKGNNGAFLRIQKSRIDGTFRKIKPENWSEEANTVFETHYSMISNIPKSKGPDMSKVLEKLQEDTKVAETKVAETKVAETKVVEVSAVEAPIEVPETKVAETKVVETKVAETEVAETKVAEVSAVEASNQLETDIEQSKAVALKAKKEEKKKKRAEMKKKKEAALKKQKEAEELKKQKEAEELKKQKEAEVLIEDIELNEDLCDLSDDEDDEEYKDFEHKNWPGKKLKLDDEGGVWDPIEDDLIAMRNSDGTFQIY